MQRACGAAQVLSVPKGKEREMLVDPAIKGTEALLSESATCLAVACLHCENVVIGSQAAPGTPC